MATTEQHPLSPFLPPNARLLMLGSFPPPRKRWSIDFFYPNMQNDMWRIMGLIFFKNRDYFVEIAKKAFNKELLVDFLSQKGIALFDTATEVNRIQDNASDKFLEVVTATDIKALLNHLPYCKAIVTTGQKATEVLCVQFGITTPPAIGTSVAIAHGDRKLLFYRMPSTSRAYPKPIAEKAAVYEHMFRSLDYDI